MTESLKKTPLHDVHVALGGKMVPFAGFHMPVQYPSGITVEHQAVRTKAGLFDVSHMGEFFLRGPQALELIQILTVNDASRLAVGQVQYSAMCLPDGGIIDDLLVYRGSDYWMLVVNASNKEKDLAWVLSHATEFDVTVEDCSDATALLALQGPKAEAILQPLTATPLEEIRYYRFREGVVAGVTAVLSRTGYTGEDGFELYVSAESAEPLWHALADAGRGHGLMPAGLGCRDSLRLEMGYPLYGNDLDEQHTPLESGLGWITKLQKGEFIGRTALLTQKEEGIQRRLVGFRLAERGFPRHGYAVVADGAEVGVVTSGVVSPTLGQGIGMAWVPASLAEEGTPLGIRIRDKVVAARVTKPPFYQGGSIRRS